LRLRRPISRRGLCRGFDLPEMTSLADDAKTTKLLGLFTLGNVDGALDRKILKGGTVRKFPDVPGAVLRFGNLPAMINADVHSGEDVIWTAVGPGSDRVRGQMDNTEVFRVMAEALGLGLSD